MQGVFVILFNPKDFLMVSYTENSLSGSSGTEKQKHLGQNSMPNPKATGQLPHLYPHGVKELEGVNYIVLKYQQSGRTTSELDLESISSFLTFSNNHKSEGCTTEFSSAADRIH